MTTCLWFRRHAIPAGLGFLLCSPAAGLAQMAVIERNATSSTRATFSYQITTTVGTRTTAEVTGNMRANTEAILNLRPGSLITNKIGDDSGNASAVFTATPDGSSVDLKGITGENLFLIDEGTTFRSALFTTDDLDPTISSRGEASALGVQTTTVTVERGETAFMSTFQQTF
jgi:hypothetical protein